MISRPYDFHATQQPIQYGAPGAARLRHLPARLTHPHLDFGKRGLSIRREIDQPDHPIRNYVMDFDEDSETEFFAYILANEFDELARDREPKLIFCLFIC